MKLNMKYFIIWILFLMQCPFGLYSQDTIVTKRGLLVACKIYKDDSVKVSFGTMHNGNEILTFLNKDSIETIRYSLTQKKTETIIIDKMSFGFGYGQDFGGFGLNIIAYPQENIGLFVGGGYAFAGFGYNAGIKARLTGHPISRVNPFILGMYGYNAAIGVSNAEQLNKLFYGSTVGIGLDFRLRPELAGYWSFAILLPFRSSEVSNYIDYLKTHYGVEFKNDLLPVTFLE